MITKAEMDSFYYVDDPWNYQKLEADRNRKEIILATLGELGPFTDALDIACGEGWITGDLPAKTIYGFELSDVAAERFPPNVKRTTQPFERKYDLMVCTGALYSEYDWPLFVSLMQLCATRLILTCNIAGRELPQAIREIKHKADQIFEREFTYDRPELLTLHKQRLRLFQIK